jgi:MFS family permease
MKLEANPDGKPPENPVSVQFMLAYVLTAFSIYMALFAPLLATIPVKISQLSGASSKAVDLGAVLAPGAFAALVAAPIFGAISDRTRSRLGRRKLWIVFGCVVILAGLVLMALATNLLMVGMGWFLVQIGANAALAANNALLPDLVPEHQRGKVSAILGIALSLALLAGTYVTTFTAGNNLLMFVTPWLMCPIAVMWLFSTFKDRPAGAMPPFKLADIGRTFWVNPIQHPDFGWAFFSRFLVFMGVAYFLTYQFIFLSDQLRLDQSAALAGLALSQLVTTIVTVSCTLLSGWISDRIGRRKPVVVVAGLLVALGLVIIAMSHTLNQFLVGAAVYGIGQGVYFAVDMALVAAVLPNPDDTAKDLGVFNIASVLPQSLAPVMAPLFLAIGGVPGGNLPAVFIAGAVIAVIGAFVILPIRKTR